MDRTKRIEKKQRLKEFEKDYVEWLNYYFPHFKGKNKAQKLHEDLAARYIQLIKKKLSLTEIINRHQKLIISHGKTR
ncbi:hypothetical protein [Pedobacter sp. NJ-S-72]